MSYKIVISDAASDRINEIKKNDSFKLRISLKAGGCAGFSSEFSIDDSVLDDDVVFEKNQALVVVNKFDIEAIGNANLNFSNDLMGKFFSLEVKKSTKGCSCGTSFAL